MPDISAPNPRTDGPFRLVTLQEAVDLGLPGAEPDPWTGNYGFIVYRIEDAGHVFVGEDGGEPEDQTLGRDWAWVVPALNEAYRLGRQSTSPALARAIFRLKDLEHRAYGTPFPSDDDVDDEAREYLGTWAS